MRIAALAFMFTIGLCPAAVITLNNPGFESGDTTGWVTAGSVTVDGTTTINAWTIGPAGSYMAHLVNDGIPVASLETFLGVTPGLLSSGLPPGTATNGSAIYQDFSGNAGDTVTVYWAYLTEDYEDYNDPAFAVVSGPSGEQLTVLASIWNGGIQVGDYGATGWHAFTYVLPASGAYRLGFGVVNTEDDEVWSHLFLDSEAGTITPEPATFALLGIGLLVLPLLRRR